ncbi:MAG: AMP-binding protein, partial [Sphaerospermopsis sp. SIO1G2]|nr:AMP-binding protein [Sphaerospermopsis sp. SIO1G2]
PLRWLQAVSQYKATHSGSPNFAYELCVLKTTPAERASLDLSSWQMTLNGAEPVRASTLDKFTEAFKSVGFQLETFSPGYGLAEATLAIVAVPVKEAANYYSVQTASLEQKEVVESTGKEKSQTFVSCGRPGIDTKVVIANPDTLNQCQPQEIGEIWISGSTVAQGYWQRPEATKETFGAYLKDTQEGPFLRTGDLGFFHNGELYIAGRIKDLIIIRGSNHYPQDIEQTVEESHPALRLGSCAAFSVDVDGTEQLVIVQEVERSYLRNLNSQEITGAIRKAVSQKHYLQVYAVLLLKTATIPKTSSGKIQRRACRSGFLDQTLNVVGEWIQESPQSVDLEQLQIESESSWENMRDFAQPQTTVQVITKETIQTWLIDYLSKNLHISAKDIEITESFAYYGIDSNFATNIVYDLSEWLKLDLDPTLLWEYPSIESLVEYLESQHKQLETVA